MLMTNKSQSALRDMPEFDADRYFDPKYALHCVEFVLANYNVIKSALEKYGEKE